MPGTELHVSEVAPEILPPVILTTEFFNLDDGGGCADCEVVWAYPGDTRTVSITKGASTPIVVTLNLPVDQMSMRPLYSRRHSMRSAVSKTHAQDRRIR